MVAALFPVSTSAQYCPDLQSSDWWGQTAQRMSPAMESNWIDSLGAAVPSDENDVCYGVLSAAHAGVQIASETCGIWWVDHSTLNFDWGAALGPQNTPEGSSAIALSKYYQSPAQPITPPDLRITMIHEGAHASLEEPYFTLRGLTDRAHQELRDISAVCHTRVGHPGLGMKVAGTGIPSHVRGHWSLAVPGIAGLTTWGVARRKKRGDASESA